MRLFELPTNLTLWDNVFNSIVNEHKYLKLSAEHIFKMTCARYEYDFLESLEEGEPYSHCPDRGRRERFNNKYGVR